MHVVVHNDVIVNMRAPERTWREPYLGMKSAFFSLLLAITKQFTQGSDLKE